MHQGTDHTFPSHPITFMWVQYSTDGGYLQTLFGRPKKETGFDFSSPDNTSDGFLKKRWKIINDSRCLVKGGSAPFQQQPFNEVIASGIMESVSRASRIPERLAGIERSVHHSFKAARSTVP